MATPDFLPPLSPADELEYFRRYHAGEEEARTVLVRANLLFVKRVALEYAAQRTSQADLTLEELISAGQFGLLKAIERFDETRGFKFITYAVWWIRQTILKALAEHTSCVRGPSRRMALLGDVSLDAPRYEFQDEAGGPTQGDYLLDEGVGAQTMVDDGDRRELVRKLLARTRDMVDRRILTWYFGLDGEAPLTLEEIGARLKLTRERIRQRRDRALNRMRAQVEGWHLAKSEVLPV